MRDGNGLADGSAGHGGGTGNSLSAKLRLAPNGVSAEKAEGRRAAGEQSCHHLLPLPPPGLLLIIHCQLIHRAIHQQ